MHERKREDKGDGVLKPHSVAMHETGKVVVRNSDDALCNRCSIT